MAPSNLAGLNVVQPVQHDPQDLASPFPDFSAHLDLWTNLAFQSDDPSPPSKPDHESPTPPGLPIQDSLQNAPHPPPLDINALLAGVGIDPLLMPAPPTHPVPSLAQLLALHAVSPPFAAPPSPAVQAPSDPPPPKRLRSQKSDKNPDSTPASPDESSPSDPPLSATEDKRRRNTAASARFRLKKKEREAALERRAKELEDRVAELERECEGLRRENGWLKGLVVGVTGAGAAQHQQASAK